MEHELIQQRVVVKSPVRVAQDLDEYMSYHYNE
jgi:hypothetical protein